MSTALLLVVLGPPALFGLALAVDSWFERRYQNKLRGHRGDNPTCPVCAELAVARANHPTHRPGPPDEWLP